MLDARTRRRLGLATHRHLLRLAARFASRFPARRVIYYGYAIMAVGVVWNVAYNAFFTASVPWAVLPLAMYSFGLSIASPALTVMVLEIFPKNRGLAASLQSFVQMMIFALISGFIAPLIFQSAFGLHEAAAGGIGAAVLNGFTRGLFSNEAGMGSAPNAAAAATPYPPHPASQGYVQMAGVFIDTILICTASAAIILLAGPVEGTGVTLVQNALTSEVGGWGKYFLAIVVLFFAFTSIVANYFYAENCLVFIEHNHPAGLLIFRLIVLAMVLFGAVGSLPFVWNFADVAMGLMAITNLIAILLLSGLAVKLARDYDAQRAAGKLPTFDANKYPEIRSKLAPGIWD